MQIILFKAIDEDNSGFRISESFSICEGKLNDMYQSVFDKRPGNQSCQKLSRLIADFIFCHQFFTLLLNACHIAKSLLCSLFHSNQNQPHLCSQSGLQGICYNLKNETPSYLVFQKVNFIQLPFTNPEII